MLRIGIAGAGVVSEHHAAAIAQLDGQTIEAVAEPVEELRDRFAAKYKVRKAYKSWEELTADGEVDLVYICTPNDLHLPISVAAMEMGKDVVCEKPLARNLAEGRQMVETARRTGHKLFISLNHRFSPANQQVKRLLVAGEIGRPFLALCTFIGNEFERMNDPRNWKGTREKCGGGTVIDNGTHMIDLLRWWFGEARAVTATCGRLAIAADNKEEDTAVLAIEFESDVMADLSLTFGARYSTWPEDYIGAAIRTEIFGLEGSIKVANDKPCLEIVRAGKPATVFEPSDLATSMPTSPQAHFASCLVDGQSPIVTMDDGLAALEIVEAAYRSAREGRRVMMDEVRGT